MKTVAALGGVALFLLISTQPAAGKTRELGPAGGGVTIGARGDSPAYRFVAISPGARPEGDLTVVERIERGSGRIDRWWTLPGTYHLPAVAYDGSPGGVSANGAKLVLSRFSLASYRFPAPRTSRFAVLDTRLHLSHPQRPWQARPDHAVTRIALRGNYDLAAISPRGRTVYLTKYGAAPDGSPRPNVFWIVAYDTRAKHLYDRGRGRLLPVPIGAPRQPVRFKGLPVTSVSGPGGWQYTLYDDGRGGDAPYLLALDTKGRRLARIDLPRLRQHPRPFELKLRIGAGGRELRIGSSSRSPGALDAEPRARLPIPPSDRAAGLEAEPNRAASEGRAPEGFLAFAETPRGTLPSGEPANLLMRLGVAGNSAEGRPIRLKQMGDPALDGVLVFGCVHGDECAGREVLPLAYGCPDPHSNVFLVPNLDPDGFAAGTRLNARGVDLNRNFAAGWRQAGEAGDPEYSGPRPFSEPETRLAARIVDRLRPEATIWFHQHWAPRPLVRAFGGSVPDGQRFAGLARMPFRAIPWPAGTGPHWQNQRFPGASSFVVELPRGPLVAAMRSRLDKALLRFARKVGED